jgi:sulfopyruvate decarboxylase subunit beta
VVTVNKTEALRAIIAAAEGRPIVFSTGHACRIAQAIADRPTHFYMTGSMGLASSIATGIARQAGRVTVVVDGDGSVLMNPVGLLTAGSRESLPLVHLVLDDGRYASTGGQVVPARADLPALATAAGYRRAETVSRVADLVELLGSVLGAGVHPAFVRCVVTGADEPVPARVGAELGLHARRFRSALAAVGGDLS